MSQLFKKIFRIALVVYVFFFAYEWARPTPRELLSTPVVYAVPDSSVHFYSDDTFLDKNGKRIVQQEIWNQILKTIAGSQHEIYLDMFLFNDFQGRIPETTRPLAEELTQALIQKKADSPHTAIAFATDPINTVYGGMTSPYLMRLRTAGVFIVMTDLIQLRDSNLFFSALWRPFMLVWGNSTTGGIFPHPFQYNGAKVTLRSWMTLLNFKANHRKLIVADEPIIENNKEVGKKMVTIVTSSNPHDGSGANGNVAIKVDDQIWQDVMSNESSIARLSNAGLPTFGANIMTSATGTIHVSFLHEAQVKDKVIEQLTHASRGDTIAMVMFYLSERSIVRALIDAANRGVQISIILDPNKDAFGYKKNGIPNQPVARELVSGSNRDITVRWCDTHGEQCHAKLFMGKTASSTFLMLGSANFTRRNISGFNLEADIFAESAKPFTAYSDAEKYFTRLWNNPDGNSYTLGYETNKDTTIWKSPLYRMMERTGISSF